jgi:tRNA pseudouridine55 synthase
MNDDIILVNKPKGMTSFDVIRILRKKLGIKKMGHAGTLDPLATGLMIIGVGKGTRKLTQYLKLDKTYETEILIGVATDTYDIDGKIIEEKEVPNLNEELIKEKLKLLEGVHEFEVPKYSAIKIKGKKLYELARHSVDFIPPKRKMQVHKVEFMTLKQYNKHYILKASFDVASGTYIRTLAVEFGKLIGYPATVYSIKRTRIGDFYLNDVPRPKLIDNGV